MPGAPIPAAVLLQTQDQMSVRLSGNINQHKWDSTYQAKHSASLRANGSRSNILQASGTNQSTALHLFEQKILQNKGQISPEMPLMIGSPQKGVSNGHYGQHPRQSRSTIVNGRTIPSAFHPQVQSAVRIRLN